MPKLKWFDAPAQFDVAKADELVWEMLRSRDLTSDTSRWGEIVDTNAVGAKLATIFKANHVITSMTDFMSHPEKGAVPDEVALEFLGVEPLLTGAVGPEQEAARDRIVKALWEWSSPNLSSPLNTSLSERGGFVLLQAKRSRSRGTSVPVKSDIRFLTADLELAKTYFVDPALKKYDSAVGRLESALGELYERQPALELSVAKYAAQGVATSQAKLSAVDVKAIEARIKSESAEEGAA